MSRAETGYWLWERLAEIGHGIVQGSRLVADAFIAGVVLALLILPVAGLLILLGIA